MRLKIYKCLDFEGHWPVGTAAVVIAPDKETARKLLSDDLKKQGLTLKDSDEFHEIPHDKAASYVLHNGDY